MEYIVPYGDLPCWLCNPLILLLRRFVRIRLPRTRLPLCSGRFSTSLASGNLPTNMRSEEHTSELQSLMRISYAVFCLTKNKHTHSLLNSMPPIHTPQHHSTH